MQRHLTWFFILIWFLAACGGDANTPPPQDETEPPPAPILRQDALPLASGNWQLVADSISYQEREAGVILAVSYQHRSLPSVGRLDMTAFSSAEEAQRVFTAHIAQVGDAARPLAALGDAAHVYPNGGAALVLRQGVLLAMIEGDAPPEYDLLNLLQIGVDTLSVQEPGDPSGGSLGSATLAPPN